MNFSSPHTSPLPVGQTRVLTISRIRPFFFLLFLLLFTLFCVFFFVLLTSPPPPFQNHPSLLSLQTRATPQDKNPHQRFISAVIRGAPIQRVSLSIHTVPTPPLTPPRAPWTPPG